MAANQIAAGTAVTPNDSTDLPGGRAYGLYIGGAGNVAVVHSAGSTAVTYIGVPVGTILPVEVTRVMATNTTATNIVALR